MSGKKGRERYAKKEPANNGTKHRYRLKFTKSGPVRFIGHLDLLSLFTMAIKRAALPIAYSEGFNPHQLISFALPLSLGYYSNGEYVDILLKTPLDCKEIVESLNKNLPEGLLVTAAKLSEDALKSSASLVRACGYRVLLPPAHRVPLELAVSFINQDSIVITKKTKKNTALADILPDIFLFKPTEKEGFTEEVHMKISSGPERSIRADSVMKALFAFAETPYPEHGLTFIREEMYAEDDEALIQ